MNLEENLNFLFDYNRILIQLMNLEENLNL